MKTIKEERPSFTAKGTAQAMACNPIVRWDANPMPGGLNTRTTRKGISASTRWTPPFLAPSTHSHVPCPYMMGVQAYPCPRPKVHEMEPLTVCRGAPKVIRKSHQRTPAMKHFEGNSLAQKPLCFFNAAPAKPGLHMPPQLHPMI